MMLVVPVVTARAMVIMVMVAMVMRMPVAVVAIVHERGAVAVRDHRPVLGMGTGLPVPVSAMR